MEISTGARPSCPSSPSTLLGLPSSVCSFSSSFWFSEEQALESNCWRMVGQKSWNSLGPIRDWLLRLWAAKRAPELKHWNRREAESLRNSHTLL